MLQDRARNHEKSCTIIVFTQCIFVHVEYFALAQNYARSHDTFFTSFCAHNFVSSLNNDLKLVRKWNTYSDWSITTDLWLVEKNISDSFIYLVADWWKNLPFVNVKSDFPVAIVDNNPSDVSLIEIRLFVFSL